MSTRAPPTFGWREALALGCAMVGPSAIVLGTVKSGGKAEAVAEDTLRRVVQVEADRRAEQERREADRAADRALALQTAERMARIEALVKGSRDDR